MEKTNFNIDEMKASGLTYEKAYKELEELAVKLNQGNKNLEESLNNFSRACVLVAFCKAELESAKEQMVKIVNTVNGTEDDDTSV